MRTLNDNSNTGQTTNPESSSARTRLLHSPQETLAHFREQVEAELYRIRLAKSAFARW